MLAQRPLLICLELAGLETERFTANAETGAAGARFSTCVSSVMAALAVVIAARWLNCRRWTVASIYGGLQEQHQLLRWHGDRRDGGLAFYEAHIDTPARADLKPF